MTSAKNSGLGDPLHPALEKETRHLSTSHVNRTVSRRTPAQFNPAGLQLYSTWDPNHTFGSILCVNSGPNGSIADPNTPLNPSVLHFHTHKNQTDRFWNYPIIFSGLSSLRLLN